MSNSTGLARREHVLCFRPSPGFLQRTGSTFAGASRALLCEKSEKQLTSPIAGGACFGSVVQESGMCESVRVLCVEFKFFLCNAITMCLSQAPVSLAKVYYKCSVIVRYANGAFAACEVCRSAHLLVQNCSQHIRFSLGLSKLRTSPHQTLVPGVGWE